MLNLTELPDGIKTAEDIINYMLDNGHQVLKNNVGSGIEYAIDDIIDSAPFILHWYKHIRVQKKYANISKRIE